MSINLVQLPAGSIPQIGNSPSVFAARQSLNNHRRTGGIVVDMLQSARRVQTQMNNQTMPKPRRLDLFA